MKKLLLLLSVIALVSCSASKRMEKAINSGDYDRAISTALEKLQTNKDKKRKADFIVMLKEAYVKAVQRDRNSLKHLKKDGNPELYKTIYELYADMDTRQNAIRPLLPLYADGKEVPFKFHDYSDAIVEYRNHTSDYLYNKAESLLDSENKFTLREAFSTFEYVENINPNYKNTHRLMDEAYARGTDYVLVSIENQTQQIIPNRLEDELLDFDTYGLDRFWTAFHGQPAQNVNYDYTMQLQLQRINISPERVNEKQRLREKEIVDGWEYQLDENGNVMQDSLGNDIKVDKIITVKARFFETIQTKSSQIVGQVIFGNNHSGQILDRFPIDSGFVFENIYARFRGDKRALRKDDLRLLNNRQVPFPSNEQMVYDTGEDLKLQLKKVINSYNFE